MLEASGLLGQNWGLAVSHARLKSVSGAEGHKATSAPRELISLSRLFRFSHKVLAFSFKFIKSYEIECKNISESIYDLFTVFMSLNSKWDHAR